LQLRLLVPFQPPYAIGIVSLQLRVAGVSKPQKHQEWDFNDLLVGFRISREGQDLKHDDKNRQMAIVHSAAG